MSTNPLTDALSPDLPTVVGALADPKCRAVLRALDGARTATEVAETAGMPRSMAYEKLRLLVEAGLVRKRASDGDVRYVADFEAVVVRPSADSLDLRVSRPSLSAAEQLSGLWSEVRSEAGD